MQKTDERPDVRTTEPGDQERLSHYVYDPEGKGRAKELLTEALINGTPLRALCGKVWTPSRDPKKYPLCGTCKEIKDRIMNQAQGG